MDSPSNVDSWQLTFQQALFIRLNIIQVLYGIYLVLYFKAMRLLLRPRERRKWSSRFYVFFSTLVLVLITIWIVTQSVLGDLIWVVNYDYPGGPSAYFMGHTSAWYQVFSLATLLVLQLLTDALMIYRCYILWDSYWPILMPCALWMATLVTGILFDWSTSNPISQWTSRLAMSYFSLVSALNILTTLLICYRTMQYGFMVRKRLGKEPATVYFGVTAAVVESMLPYTFTGILFLITFAIGSPWSQLFLSMNSMFNVISPQILILRVITGRTWKRDASLAPTSFRFAAASVSLGGHGISDIVAYPLEIPAVSTRTTDAPESPSTDSPLHGQSISSATRTNQKQSMEGRDERV